MEIIKIKQTLLKDNGCKIVDTESWGLKKLAYSIQNKLSGFYVLIDFEYEGDLKRSVVEMAKDWRMDKMLRHLEALLLVMDKKNSFIIAGDGNVIEPDGPVLSIGSGGGFAQAAALAFHQSGKYSAKQVAEKSLKIAADLCIYTNDSITVLEI